MDKRKTKISKGGITMAYVECLVCHDAFRIVDTVATIAPDTCPKCMEEQEVKEPCLNCGGSVELYDDEDSNGNVITWYQCEDCGQRVEESDEELY